LTDRLSALHDDLAPLYGVGQVAAMLDVQAAYLRRLDTEAVIQPARTEGGQRRYSRADIAQVQRVTTMAGEGMTLAGIRRILVLEQELADLRRQLEAERAKRRSRPSRPR
jgi:MerR family transcriptional regulator/heat shock protein HspR